MPLRHPVLQPLRLLIAFLCFGLLAATAGAIEIPTLQRGPELERLDFLTGQWRGTLTRYLPGGAELEIQPRLDTRWSLGGAWLESRDRTELPGGEDRAGTVIHNRTWITWDARAGAYAGAWQDNVMPGFVQFRGRWVAPDRLELDTGEFELFGRPHRVIFTYTRLSDDEFTVEMRQGWDGTEPRRVAGGSFSRQAPL